MKQLFSGLCLIFLSFNCLADQAKSSTHQDDVTSAKVAIKTFAGALQTELKTSMQNGGPVAAIENCNTRAIPITEQISSEKGMLLNRVSLKNRNPDNAPNSWQADVLRSFEDQKSAGKDPATISWSETVNSGQGKEFRFMKAIPTAGVCLVCHGTAISQDVSQKLAELYPQDQAVDFIEGDIRGAFVVTRKIQN
jgi:hypothetical protein